MTTTLCRLRSRIEQAIAAEDMPALLRLEMELLEHAWNLGQDLSRIDVAIFGREKPAVKC